MSIDNAENPTTPYVQGLEATRLMNWKALISIFCPNLELSPQNFENTYLVHFPFFADFTQASMKAMPATPSSMPGNCTSLSGFLPRAWL